MGSLYLLTLNFSWFGLDKSRHIELSMRLTVRLPNKDKCQGQFSDKRYSERLCFPPSRLLIGCLGQSTQDMNLATLLRLSQKNGWNYTSTPHRPPVCLHGLNRNKFSFHQCLRKDRKISRYCTYNVKLWRVPVTITPVEITMRSVCVAELNDAVSYITTLFASFFSFYNYTA